MSDTASPPIVTTIEDGVGKITLGAPDKGNPLSIELANGLLDAVQSFAEDASVRCVLLTGSGRFFCVGGDISAMLEAAEKVGEVIETLTTSLHAAVQTLLEMEKPLVTAVNGPVAGGGLGLALCGDIVLCGPKAHFSMAYTGIGFSPDGGSTWLLPRLVGLRLAQEMALTNRRLSSEEAAALGLVTRVVDGEDLDLQAEAVKVAAELARGPVGAYSATRRLLLDSHLADPASQMRREAASVKVQATGPEGREGLAAFVEKRPADFSLRQGA